MERDPHSFSSPDEMSVRHIKLDLEVDFESKNIVGRADLYLNPHVERVLVLDTHGLDIERVMVGGAFLTETEFVLGDEVEFLGRPLSIKLPTKGNVVRIQYIAHRHAKALQWLEPSQTTDRQHAFLFTQSQTIGARTWIPCQDTPSVRMTFSARVKVPKGLMAVMSAENPTIKSPNGVYEFKTNHPIPSYLFALAVGDLEFRALGPRSGVYAERAVVSQAAWEFGDIGAMIRAAETLYGRYRWERFDLIVLPPSFPFGGMENPQLVFVTPSLLSGDRSLTSVVAHELAHSWSGNLVTNATWNDFWLNEGFSVYTEHRIMEEIYGRAYDDMLAVLSLRSLKKELAVLPPRDTWLNLDLSGRHPDECFTGIPYEKGYFFASNA